MKNVKTVINLFICFLFLVFLVSCGCNKTHYKSYTTIKEKMDVVYKDGTDDVAKENREDKLIELMNDDTMVLFNSYKNAFVDIQKLTTDKETAIIESMNAVQTNLNSTLTQLVNGKLDLLVHVKEIADTYNNAIDELNSIVLAYLSATSLDEGITSLTKEQYQAESYTRLENATLILYLVEVAKIEVSTIVDDSEYKDYQTILFEADREKFNEELNAVKTTIETTDYADGKTYDQIVMERSAEVYKIMEKAAALIAEHAIQPEPIRFKLTSFGEFFSNFFDNFLIYPVGILLMFFSKIFGGYYIFGLVITTLLIRTIGWPIYTKTNDMSLKMKLMEPEQAKIQEKYARRKDPESQKMQQMEMMHLYKKYKIGVGGCLLPFLQFPIFMAVYRAITRLPYTDGSSGSPDWVSKINPNVFGLNLFEDRTAGQAQLIGIIILCVLVVGTQLLSQYITTKRQKEQQKEAQADIPAYRRQAAAQTNSMQSSMKIFMYMMTAMMAVFVFTSKAGLGVYWLIGNLYAIAQTFISTKSSAKRLEALKKKHNGVSKAPSKKH